MKVKELREKLAEFPDNYEVLTKKTELLGNCGQVGCVRADKYSTFGVICDCVMITDEFGYGEENDE